MFDIDVTRPLPELTLGEGDTGVAVLVRRHGRPVGWTMRAYPPGTTLSAEEVDRLITWSFAAKLVQEAIVEELPGPPDGAPIDLSVAICTRDRLHYLEPCLEALLGLGEGFEVVVVDNAPSDDRTERFVAGLPGARVRYVTEPCAGLDFARNRALREATGEWIAFLDDDVEVDRGWLGGLREALAENPDAAAVTGLVLPYELATDAQVAFESRGGFRRGFDKLRYVGPTLPRNPLYPYGAGIFGAGCNMAFRRQVVLDLGGFDEALDTGPPLPGGGDLDMFHRVVRGGHPLVYEPSYLVYHKHRREHEALRRQYWTWGTGFMAFVSKYLRQDAAARPALFRLVRWWLKEESTELVRSVAGRSPLSPDLVAAELAGGVVGLAGTYERSVRRSQQIRRDGQRAR